MSGKASLKKWGQGSKMKRKLFLFSMLKPLKSSLFTSLSVSYVIFTPLALNGKLSYFKESQVNLAAETICENTQNSFQLVQFFADYTVQYKFF